MHTGKIKKLIREKGFGFISDTDGTEVFFHKNNLVGIDFSALNENDALEFEVEKSPKGMSAVKISIAKT
ncbi:MAG: cold shock domain-containing protein [Candidatus Omnitrophica bacterium]|nr:cold shock domain-containing protein [Candidatus Omnitrophota bacterium]